MARIDGVISFDHINTSSSSDAEREHRAFAAQSSEMKMDEDDIEVIPVPETFHLSDPSTDMPLDQKMMFGEHKGKMFSEMVDVDPEYDKRLVEKYHSSAKYPKYVSAYLEWSENVRKSRGVTQPKVRSRHKILPEKKKESCRSGCTKFTRLGSNQHESRVTCLDCGHVELRTID